MLLKESFLQLDGVISRIESVTGECELMDYSRIMIAAMKSGSGKTTITCGILRALKNMGVSPCSFKCGPDYIDPMFHRNVLGIEAGNLDTFFTDEAVTKSLFLKSYSGDIAVIEGVMGLFDGVGGVEKMGSSYDLSRVLKAPVILVVDAKGAGRSIIAQIKGFLDYDNANLIKGVILNRTSPSFGKTLGELIEKELKVKYLGTVPNIKEQEISSRHLGLVMPQELPQLQERMDELAQVINENINLEEFKKIATEAPKLDIIKDSSTSESANTKVLLAVARDEAFCFYYKENLQMLSDYGVKLVEFSPLRDKRLPDGISGILFGGGYPENYLSQLSSNESLKEDIRKAFKAGMPIFAECGGFMYLSDSITDSDGNTFPMVSAIKSKIEWKGKLTRFGYITVDTGTLSVKGHEFHYYDSDNNGEGCVATKPFSGKSYRCIHKINGGYIGFPHLYYPSNPDFVKNIVEAMKNYGRH